MSKQSISKLTTDKDAQGNHVQKVLTVQGPVCVSGATTQHHIYEDNANRSFLLHIDESKQHLAQVMEYQRQARAGRVDTTAQQAARTLLQHAQRLLQPVEVINPYAPYLRIPEGVFKKLRTNWHYLRLIEIISLYHQHQREVKESPEGRRYIETSLSDIEWANMLVKDSLLRKSDELSGAVRDFFERLKAEVAPTPGTFFAKDIRKAFRMHPQTLSRHLSLLSRMGYVRKISSNARTGYEYEICSWEDYEALKAGLNILDQTLEKLQTVSFTAASHSFTNQDVKLETVNSS